MLGLIQSFSTGLNGSAKKYKNDNKNEGLTMKKYLAEMFGTFWLVLGSWWLW